MNSKKIGLKLKGFTLIEMLIVITIIAILGGLTSLAVSGFRRDARIESDNNKAQMIYSGFQDILIQSEIYQDDSLFDADAVPEATQPDSSTYTRTYLPSTDKLTYAVVEFGMAQGQVDSNIVVTSIYGNDSTKEVTRTLLYNATNSENKKLYEEYKKAILSIVDVSFEGIGRIYVDYENYTVDSACYFESSSDYTSESLSTLDNFGWKDDADSKGKCFYSLKSLSDHKDVYKYDDVCYGVYPYMNNYKSYCTFS